MSVQLGWYVPTKRGYRGRQKPRWVLAIGDERVIYATGGEQHRECKRSTFEKWQKRIAAEFNPVRVAATSSQSNQLEIA